MRGAFLARFAVFPRDRRDRTTTDLHRRRRSLVVRTSLERLDCRGRRGATGGRIPTDETRVRI